MTPLASPQCKYAIYTRKSSESEERQIMSIEAQLDELNKRFGDLNIVSVIEESGSAFKPNNRPKFNALLEQISQGQINGIITWHPDRISRNPLDAAQIVHLIQTGLLQDIKFATYPFYNSPDGVMMLQISLSQSQYFSSKLSVDVKRGMNKKRDKGWRPCRAPVGYLGDATSPKGEKRILVDKERFPLIKQVFEMMLTGLYSAEYVRRQLNEEWGYLSRKTKKRGGIPMTSRGIYHILKNKFYAGIIVNPDGTETIGRHPAMITVEQFEQLQKIMKGRKGSHTQTLEFQYKPLLQCGECGGKVTAENKIKKLKNGTILNYKYYHCTYKKKGHKCKQPCIEEKQITAYFKELAGNSTFHPVLKVWALHSVSTDDKKEIQPPKSENLTTTIATLEKRRKGLHDAYYDGDIEKDEFTKTKAEIEQQLNKLKQSKSKARAIKQQKTAHCIRTIDFLYEGKNIIENGTLDEKMELLQKIGSNLSLKNKELSLDLNPWVIAIQDFNEMFKSRIERFETAKNGSEISLIEENQDMYEIWSSLWRTVRTSIEDQFVSTMSHYLALRKRNNKKPIIPSPSQTAEKMEII